MSVCRLPLQPSLVFVVVAWSNRQRSKRFEVEPTRNLRAVRKTTFDSPLTFHRLQTYLTNYPFIPTPIPVIPTKYAIGSKLSGVMKVRKSSPTAQRNESIHHRRSVVFAFRVFRRRTLASPKPTRAVLPCRIATTTLKRDASFCHIAESAGSQKLAIVSSFCDPKLFLLGLRSAPRLTRPPSQATLSRGFPTWRYQAYHQHPAPADDLLPQPPLKCLRRRKYSPHLLPLPLPLPPPPRLRRCRLPPHRQRQ